MLHTRRKWALAVAALAGLAALLVGWRVGWLGSWGPEPSAPRAPSAGAEGPDWAPEPRSPPPSPEKPIDADAGRRSSDGPFAAEQPPADYMGPPDAGAMPLRPPPVAAHTVLSADALRGRRRQMVTILEAEVEALELEASRSDERGHHDHAGTLRARRQEREARRDALLRLIAEE